MSTRRRRASSSDVRLPWEARQAWMSGAFSGQRLRPLSLVAAIVALLVGAWKFAEERNRRRETYAAIAEVHRAIAGFRAELERCPRSTIELVHPPKAGAQYLETLPSDGWGREFLVRCPGLRDPNGADVISAGPSGAFDKDDNIL